MNQSIYAGIAVTGLFLSGAGFYLFSKSDSQAETGNETAMDSARDTLTPKNHTQNTSEQEKLRLAVASDLWTDKVIPLSEACVFWVATEEEKKESGPRPMFDREPIDQFYTEYVENRSYISGSRKTIIIRLLKLLDRDGACPSVVRNKKHAEAENKYTDDVFSLLAEIPLWEHSLDVARNMVQRVGRDTLIPDAMIAALAHDIGKIPLYHDKGYSTGDHPIISAIVLSGMNEFTQLPSRDEVEQVVRNHHAMKPPNTMAALLKTCDQLVRNQELAHKLKNSVAEDIATADAPVSTETQEPLKSAPKRVPVLSAPPSSSLPQPPDDPDTQPDHPMGLIEKDKCPTFTHERVEVRWLSQEALLSELGTWINVVSSGRWGAVSMPDGLVYVNSDCLWGLMKKIAPSNPDLLAADADEARKRNILFSVVWTLSEQRDAVAAEMLGPGYYMIPVSIISGQGKRLASTPLLIPFRASAFGVLPSELEKRKSRELWGMVKSIKPKENNYQ